MSFELYFDNDGTWTVHNGDGQLLGVIRANEKDLTAITARQNFVTHHKDFRDALMELLFWE